MRSGEFHTLNNVCAAMDLLKLLWGRVKSSSSDNRKIYTTSQLDWMNVELFLLLFHSLDNFAPQVDFTSSNTRILLVQPFFRQHNFSKSFFFLISRFSSPSSWARFASRATPSCWSPRRCSCRLFEFSSYFHCHFLWVISIGIFCKWNFVCMRNILRILPKSSCRSMSWKMCNRCKQTRVILEPSSLSVFAIQEGKKRQLSIQVQTSSSRRMEWNSIKSESVAKMRSILLSLSFHLCKGKRLFSVVHNKRMTSQRARSVTVTGCKREHRSEFSDAHLAAHSLFRLLELSSSFPLLFCVNI